MVTVTIVLLSMDIVTGAGTGWGKQYGDCASTGTDMGTGMVQIKCFAKVLTIAARIASFDWRS